MIARVELPLSVIELARRHELTAAVICGQDTSTPPVAQRLLDERHCRAVATLSRDGKRVLVRSRDGRPQALVDPSPAALLAAIATAAGTRKELDDA